MIIQKISFSIEDLVSGSVKEGHSFLSYFVESDDESQDLLQTGWLTIRELSTLCCYTESGDLIEPKPVFLPVREKDFYELYVSRNGTEPPMTTTDAGKEYCYPLTWLPRLTLADVGYLMA